MNFFTGFFKAIGNCFKGINLVFEKGLWPYLFYPLFLWLLMWGASIWLFAELAKQIVDYFNQFLEFDQIPDSGATFSFAKPFLTGYFSFILAWILKIFFWLISGTFIKYLVLIFLSPVLALLSEAVEKKMTGADYPFQFGQLLKDIGRGILISLRNMFFEYFIMAVCFIATLFFAPLAFITGPLLIFTAWYFTGFTMMDYNFERHKMSISESVQFARKNRGLICGIGLAYSVLMMLPLFLGIMFAPVLAISGATISFLELRRQGHLSY